LDILCEAVGGTFKVIAVTQNEEIVGGVALYEKRTRCGIYVDTRLLLFYNGVVLREYDTKYPSQKTSRHLKIMAALEEALSKAGCDSMRLKNRSCLTDVRVFQQHNWMVTLTYTYVVALDDIKSTWDRIEQNQRRLVKRCEQQEMQISEGDDFDSLFRMHLEIHQRKGAPLYMPYEQFKRYFERLRSNKLCRLYHARLPDGKAVSSQLVLTCAHPVTHTVCAAADANHLNSGATTFLRWKAFEDLARLGYTATDLTNASLSPVTRFKGQLGGDLQICLMLAKPGKRSYRMFRGLEDFLYKQKVSITSMLSKSK